MSFPYSATVADNPHMLPLQIEWYRGIDRYYQREKALKAVKEKARAVLLV